MATYQGDNFGIVNTALKNFANNLSNVLGQSAFSTDIPLLNANVLRQNIDNGFITPLNNALNNLSSNVTNTTDFINNLNGSLSAIGTINISDWVETEDYVRFSLDINNKIGVYSPFSLESSLPHLEWKSRVKMMTFKPN